MPTGKKTFKQIRIADAAPSYQRAAGRRIHVVRGVLPPEFFDALTIPPYQRNAMKGQKHEELVAAFDPEDGIGVPDDVTLCVRQDNIRPADGGEVIIRTSEMIVLDGHQRIDALIDRVANSMAVDPLGVKVLLGTEVDEEKFLFYQQNRKQTKVATPVFVRNSDDTDATAALKEMVAESPDFVKIQWDQERPRGSAFITALTLYKVASILHGYPLLDEFEDIIENLDEVADDIGTEKVVENVRTFFKVVEQCFDKDDRRKYTYRVDSLRALAMLFRDHLNFWAKSDTDKLQVSRNDIKNIQALALTKLEGALAQSNAATSLAHLLEARFMSTRDNPLVQKPRRQRKSKSIDD